MNKQMFCLSPKTACHRDIVKLIVSFLVKAEFPIGLKSFSFFFSKVQYKRLSIRTNDILLNQRSPRTSKQTRTKQNVVFSKDFVVKDKKETLKTYLYKFEGSGNVKCCRK